MGDYRRPRYTGMGPHPSLIVLDLFLQALGIDIREVDLSNPEERKRIQRTVYLAQLTGVDLGYRFQWR